LRSTFDLHAVGNSDIQDAISIIDGEGENRSIGAFQPDAKRAMAHCLDYRDVSRGKVQRWNERQAC